MDNRLACLAGTAFFLWGPVKITGANHKLPANYFSLYQSQTASNG
jgi:hypothetical protein